MRLTAIFLLSLSAVQVSGAFATEANVRGATSNYAAVSQRRGLGAATWWTNLMNDIHCSRKKSECGHKSSHKSGGSSGGADGGADGDADGGSDGANGDDSSNVEADSSDDQNYQAGDGWKSNNLETGGSSNTTVWPFVVAAMVAGLVGTAFIVKRKNREEGQETQPIEESLKKRMKLFQKKKRGLLNDDVVVDHESPQLIEISRVPTAIRTADVESAISTADDASVTSSSSRAGQESQTSSYNPPAHAVVPENNLDEP